MEIQERCLPNRPRKFENGKNKLGENSFSVSLDLTKQRYNRLKIVQGIVKEMDNVYFVCVDVNSSRAMRFTKYEYEFHSLLNDN